MSWENTDINMAPRAGRASELRGEASRERLYREIVKQKRSQRSLMLQSRVSGVLAGLPGWIKLSERPPTQVIAAD